MQKKKSDVSVPVAEALAGSPVYSAAGSPQLSDRGASDHSLADVRRCKAGTEASGSLIIGEF